MRLWAVVLVVTGMLAATAGASVNVEARLAVAAGVRVTCHTDTAWPYGERFKGWYAPALGIMLRQRECGYIARAFHGIRSGEVVYGWTLFAHEYGHALGYEHESCPTSTVAGITRLGGLAQRAGLPSGYRRWLVKKAHAYLGYRFDGEVSCPSSAP